MARRAPLASIGFALTAAAISRWDLVEQRRQLLHLVDHDRLDAARIGHDRWHSNRSWNIEAAVVAHNEGASVLLVARHGGELMSMAWSGDGDRVVSASENGRVYVWDVHRAGESLDELDAFIARRVPFRLVDSRLARTRR